MRFLRQRYGDLGALTTQAACARANGARVCTAGVVLVRQKPGSANGVVFITLEDEVGIANLVVWPKVLERFRPVVMGARILFVKGRIQTADNVTHIVANELIDRTGDLNLLSEDAQRDPLKAALSYADEVLRPVPEDRRTHPRNVRIIPKSRDFH